MHNDYPSPQLTYLRAGATAVWRMLYAHRLLNAVPLRVLEVGEVVQLFRFSRQAGSLWAQVDTLQFVTNQRVYQKGFLRVPAIDPSSILGVIPDYRYFVDIVPGGLP